MAIKSVLLRNFLYLQVTYSEGDVFDLCITSIIIVTFKASQFTQRSSW